MRGVVSPELRDFLFGTETGSTKYTQTAVDFSATGDLFDLPAGTVAMAAGLHYREDEIDDIPGEITAAGNTWGSTAAGRTQGSDETTAFFVEFDIPLLADIPAIQNFTLNASARFTDVSSYGDDTTWKIGVNWQIVDSLRLRANRGTSFRTPALFELYLADQTDFGSARWDPCIQWGDRLLAGDISQTVADNCAADQSSIGGPAAGLPSDYGGGTITPTVFAGGGFGELVAETSVSETIGLIWQPAFADLSVSVDYFDITVNNEVDQFGGSIILRECYQSDFGFAFGNTEPLCTLFDRTNANDGIDNIIDNFLNIAVQRNRGWDFAVRYDTELGSLGSLGVDLRATQQVEDTKGIFFETAEDLNGTIGDPEWVGKFNFTFNRGPLAINYGGNYVGSSDSTRLLPGDGTIQLYGVTYDAVLSTNSVFYHNISVSYEWEDTGITAMLGVANFTGENPPQVTTEGGVDEEIAYVGNSVLYSQYDWFGRRAYLNLIWSFE
jgi:iron complex outermembrane receptor protein